MNAAVYHPAATRKKLLESAFQQFWKQGFQSASLDDILAATDVTKGALYHHFKNKMELGYAVVDEILVQMIAKNWDEPLQTSDSPIDTLAEIIQNHSRNISTEVRLYGCPIYKLAQEMAPLDEDFRIRIDALFKEWQKIIAEALQRGQKNGSVRKGIDCRKSALFTVSSFEGAIGIAITAKDASVFVSCMDGLLQYLESLKP